MDQTRILMLLSRTQCPTLETDIPVHLEITQFMVKQIANTAAYVMCCLCAFVLAWVVGLSEESKGRGRFEGCRYSIYSRGYAVETTLIKGCPTYRCVLVVFVQEQLPAVNIEIK